MDVKASSWRKRADEIKPFRCKNTVVVLENPMDVKNIGTAIRNANAMGVDKIYVVDSQKKLPDDWESMRNRRSLSKTSVSAIRWTFVKRFDSTEACISHLRKKRFVSVVTSPHVKGKKHCNLESADFTQTRLAIWFGNESRGISNEALAQSEFCTSIPMFGMIESLNLGTTTGIVLYEVTKQRRAFQEKYKRAIRRPKVKM